ncbi:coiled-coil domain-containing protein 14 isoform X2 [Plectropomus leopardus]|nr:coiled-coil domain-containing protein 14 isoform X2 [Plectropomus leopardus]
MKGAAKSKVVTSGRLTGAAGKVQPTRRRVTPNPGAAAHPEPAYSLYSTDSEDQVTSLHKGLDRCAALLSDILQADRAASPVLPKAVKGGAAKSTPSAPLRRKSIKKLTPKIAAHSGVKLQSPRKQPATLRQARLSPSPRQTLRHLPPNTPPPQTVVSQPQPTPDSLQLPVPLTECQAAPDAPHTHGQAEEKFVPVRDISVQNTAADTHCGVESEDVKVETVQYLLGELKSLITGQGSVAERLLSRLEHTLSSPQMNVGISNIQTEPELSSLQSQNTQLRRRVRTLNQQLKEREKAERQQNMETLCNSQVLTLQEELTTAQSRLQELQDDLTELRKALKDTRSQLTDREAENTLIRADLEATRTRLLDSEQEKSELASLAQQRLEEIAKLNRILQSQDSSGCPTMIDSSVSDQLPTKQQQQRQDAAEPPTERIAHFLLSLGQLEQTHIEHVRVAAEREGHTPEQETSVQLRDTLLPPDVTSQRGDKTSACLQNSHLNQVQLLRQETERRRLLNSSVSQCDVESVLSDWSMRSGSTFDTRDEEAFRDGLAALDASIASLQKTIKLDLGR